jgi:uncharacterized membrane protein
MIHVVLLMGILVGAALLRFHHLGKTSFWNDEICSVLYERGQTAAVFSPPNGYFEHAPAIASVQGTRPLIQVWSSFDSNPPLYATVLRVWWWMVGDGDVSARALSAVLSLATIALLFDLGRLMAGPAVALWACALYAASPPQVHYAQEARPYALVGLLGVVVCDLAIRITRFGGSGRRYLLIGVFCVAALLTHFFIAGAIAALALYGLIALRGRARVAMLCVIAIALSVELWALPVMSRVVAQQGAYGGLAWLTEPRAGLLARTLKRIASLPATYLIQPPDDASIVGLPSIVLLIVPLCLNNRRPGLLLAGLWPTGIIGLVAASDLWSGRGALAYVRYTLAASPMVFISFAVLSEMGGRWTRHFLPLLAVAGALLAIPQVYNDEFWEKTESRALAQDVRSHVVPGDVLVILSGPDMGFWSAGEEFLSLDFYTGPLRCAVAVLDGPASPTVRQSIWLHKHVWVVQTFCPVNVSAYLGPCRLTPVATTRYHAGRLYDAQALP